MRTLEITEETKITPIMGEVYKRLRTSIEFSGAENKAICITSVSADDGKSVVSYNLAKALAKAKKRTVLVDADMRNSVLDKRLGYKSSITGLSHYLAGRASAVDCVYKTSEDNLFLIPSGIFPKNPSELLSQKLFTSLIAKLKSAFDYVIVDTPPIGLVIDAAVIAKNCDASAIVVASDTASRKVVRIAIEEMRQANENLLGVILNKINTRSSGGKYGYGYGYGYGNGYGYGYGNVQQTEDDRPDIESVLSEE